MKKKDIQNVKLFSRVFSSKNWLCAGDRIEQTCCLDLDTLNLTLSHLPKGACGRSERIPPLILRTIKSLGGYQLLDVDNDGSRLCISCVLQSGRPSHLLFSTNLERFAFH